MGDLAAGKDFWDKFCSLIQTMAAKPIEFSSLERTCNNFETSRQAVSHIKSCFIFLLISFLCGRNFCPAVERSGTFHCLGTSISLFQDFFLSLRAKPDFLGGQKKVLIFYQLLNLLMFPLASFLKGFW